MTRLFIDTRSRFGYRVAARTAGACDLDVVILAPREQVSVKTIEIVKRDLKHTSAVSRASVLEIPCHTVDAIEVVRDAAQPNDIIVTNSSPLALEFLVKAGAASNSWGEEYAYENILGKVDEFYRCRTLKQHGLNPYKSRRYRSSDRQRLKDTLVDLIRSVCGAIPKEGVDYRVLPKKLPVCKSCTDIRVFVDGDACPVTPEIIQVCGSSHVPMTYVSNRRVRNLLSEAARKRPSIVGEMSYLPEITLEQVPVESDSADAFIREMITPSDIVITDDVPLALSCLNKGASAISFSGCIAKHEIPGVRMSAQEVELLRREWRAREIRRGRSSKFKHSLAELLAAG